MNLGGAATGRYRLPYEILIYFLFLGPGAGAEGAGGPSPPSPQS